MPVRWIDWIAGGTAGHSLSRRVFNCFVLVAALAFGAAGAFCLALGMHPALTIIVALIAVLYAIVYVLTRFLNRFELVFTPTLLFGVLSLGLLYFVSGGLTGSVPVMFLLAVVILTAAVDGRSSPVLTVFALVVFILVYFLELRFPEWVVPYPNEAARRADILFTVILCCLAAAVVIWLLRRNYDAERAVAERASRARAEFLSIMSHEIRTPMNSVAGMTRLLLDENPRPDQVENLELLRFSAENMLTLLNDILDFSKIEAGKITLEDAPFDPGKLMQNIRDLLAPEAARKGLSFEAALSGDAPRLVRGDATRLAQALTNLAANAIKFTESGFVRMEIRGRTEGDAACFECSVTDSGIGIPADKLEVIFEKFAQAASDTTRRFGGVGLGLAITRKLVELMGGTVRVESETGRGSRFSFELRLPLAINSAALPTGRAAERARAASAAFAIDEPGQAARGGSRGSAGPMAAPLVGARLLLVEDYEPNVILMRKFLSKWGVLVEVAANGLEATERVAAASYDVILMDLQMPVMDGFEATRKIRGRSDERRRIPIIALTAAAMPEERERARAAGVNAYVTKPFEPGDLYNRIAECLAARGDFDPAAQGAAG